jgi:hypothetical protein
MRKRYIYDDEGNAHEYGTWEPPRADGLLIMPDIQPYRSMIDGREITSRSRHREHLKDHNCIEIGNDSSLFKGPQPIQSPPGLKDAIIRAVNEVEQRRH